MAFTARAPVTVLLSPTRSAAPYWVVNSQLTTMLGGPVDKKNERYTLPAVSPTIFMYCRCKNSGGK